MRGLIAALALFAAAPAQAGEAAVALDDLLVVDTGKGQVLIELVPQAAPAHVARIKELAREGYYDGAQFYRVVPNYIAQTGERAPATGRFSSGKPDLKAEFAFPAAADVVGPLPVLRSGDQASARFCPGVVAMAHYDDPDSANSQFFIVTGPAPLERQFTVFGRVIQGLDAVKALNPGEPPAAPDVMTKVRLASDDPAFKGATVTRSDLSGTGKPCDRPLETKVSK